MRILLDHCVPKRLGRQFPNHHVRTAQQMGWAALRNGALLSTAAADFDVMLTVDRRIQYQQNPSTLPLSVIVLVAVTNKIKDLVHLVPQVEQVMVSLSPRTLVEVRIP